MCDRTENRCRQTRSSVSFLIFIANMLGWVSNTNIGRLDLKL